MSETASGSSGKPPRIEDVLRHAVMAATDTPPPAVAARVAELAKRFDAAVAGLPPVPLTILTFHLTLPEENRRIDYLDIKADQGTIDYGPVLQHTFAMARGFNPDCRIIYVTGDTDDASFVPADVIVVRLPLSPAWLMYERVVAVNAYMQSAAFSSNTAFLDSDAFANWPLAGVFDGGFDVAVTFRDSKNFMMTLNEGVIFAAYRDGGNGAGDGARRFFTRYLATYEALCVTPEIVGLYGDIRRWRGGQLSLNGAAGAMGVFSDFDRRVLGGAIVQYLSCDDFNFFIRDEESYSKKQLQRRYILHLKGPNKRSTAAVAKFQHGWLERVRADGVNVFAPMLKDQLTMAPADPVEPPQAEQPAAQPAPIDYIKPFFAFFNKEYTQPPFHDKAVLQKLAEHVQAIAQILSVNRPGSGAVAVDDMMTWFRNAAFLSQPDFIAAMGPHVNDQILRARIWRIYMLCWAAKSCLRLEGDYMDVGCYDGRTVEVMERYTGFRGQTGKTWYLYDIFDEPPAEARKSGHGPQLFETVRDTFEPLGNFRVIKGAVPDSFAQGLPEKVAFAQLDLNVAGPELAALEILYDRMVPGGIIVFDDFGFRRYRESHDLETAFLQARGDVIWESPTGQGLFIKR